MKNSYLHYFARLIYASGLLLLLGTVPAAAGEVAGTVELVDGTVWIQGTDNKFRPIETEQPLYEGDIIITGKDGELQARMQDEAIIAVRANSKLKIESYRARGDEDDNAVFSLLVGTFRSVTGWIGKYNRRNYAIKTTAATIGVRGTDHEPMVVPPPVPGMKPLGQPGVYDKVNAGRIVIRNRFGETEFGQGQAGFVGLNSQVAPVKLKSIPEFFRASRNEKRIRKIKQRQPRRLQRELIKQQQILRQQHRMKKPDRPLPRLLNSKAVKSGFVPGTAPLDRKLQQPQIKQPQVKQTRPAPAALEKRIPQQQMKPHSPIQRPQPSPTPRQLEPLHKSPLQQAPLPQQRKHSIDDPVDASSIRHRAPMPLNKPLPTAIRPGLPTRTTEPGSSIEKPAAIKPSARTSPILNKQVTDKNPDDEQRVEKPRLKMEPLKTIQPPAGVPGNY